MTIHRQFLLWSWLIMLACAWRLFAADGLDPEHRTPEAPAPVAPSWLQSFRGADELSGLVEAAGRAKVVLLGEASHGTMEFYTLRDAISRRLIDEHGFQFIAVEGDWNAIYRLNRYVKGDPDAGSSARSIMQSFSRWPVWMWANEEAEALVEWLRARNESLPRDKRAGFYGIDVYGSGDALLGLPAMMEQIDADQAGQFREHLRCLAPFASDFGDYARALQWGMQDVCAGATLEIVRTLRENRAALNLAPDDYLHLKQMAYVVKNAEKHYRAMLTGGPDSWNHRADHFFATLERLLNHYGPGARGIVWAHNTHIGDARATPMAAAGQRNIGEQARRRWGDDAFAVGFGTHRGRVVAGRNWGGEREIMSVPPAGLGTLEAWLHQSGLGNLWFFTADLEPPLDAVIGHRAIGVIYHPEHEYPGNYVPTLLPARYQAFVFIDETHPLTPIHL